MPKRSLVLAIVLVPVFSAFSSSPGGRSSGPALKASAPTAEQYRAVLDQYCVTCHNERLKTGGLTLDTMDLVDVAKAAEVWEKVVRKLRAGTMPPVGSARGPIAATSDGLAAWLETALDRAAAAHPQSRPAAASSAEPRRIRQRRSRSAGARRRRGAAAAARRFGVGFDNIADVARRVAGAARALSVGGGEDQRAGGRRSRHRRRAPRPIRRAPGRVAEPAHRRPAARHASAACWRSTTLPLDGEYVFKVKLLQTNLGAMRGLEIRTSSKSPSTANGSIWRHSAATTRLQAERRRTTTTGGDDVGRAAAGPRAGESRAARLGVATSRAEARRRR